MVDVDLSDLQEDAEQEEWLSPLATQTNTFFKSRRNFIRFKYDFRLQKFTMSMKAMALNVGKCRAKPVMRFLRNNAITNIQSSWLQGSATNHLGQYPELRINRRVWYEEDEEFYVIDGVGIEAGLIMLHNETVHELGISVRIDDTDAYQLV